MNRAWARRRAALFDAGEEMLEREPIPRPARGAAARRKTRHRSEDDSRPPTRRRRRTTAARRQEPKDFTRRDYARSEARGARSLPWGQIGAGLLIGAMLLVSLRLAILRTRYELADALETETGLLEQERASTVEARKLRDPQRLQRLALERGFARPERVIELAPSAPQPTTEADVRP